MAPATIDILSLQGPQAANACILKVANRAKKLESFRVFSKDVKSYVLDLQVSNCTCHFPRKEKESLNITLRYIIIQLCIPLSKPFQMELGFSGSGGLKRRVIFSTTTRTNSLSALHARLPFNVDIGGWMNVVFDLEELVYDCFDGDHLVALESIIIRSHCFLRRILACRDFPVIDELKVLSVAGNHHFPVHLYSVSSHEEENVMNSVPSSSRDDSTLSPSSSSRLHIKTSRFRSPPDRVVVDLYPASSQGERPVIAFGSRITGRSESRSGNTTLDESSPALEGTRVGHRRTAMHHKTVSPSSLSSSPTSPSFRSAGTQSGPKPSGVGNSENRSSMSPIRESGSHQQSGRMLDDLSLHRLSSSGSSSENFRYGPQSRLFRDEDGLEISASNHLTSRSDKSSDMPTTVLSDHDLDSARGQVRLGSLSSSGFPSSRIAVQGIRDQNGQKQWNRDSALREHEDYLRMRALRDRGHIGDHGSEQLLEEYNVREDVSGPLARARTEDFSSKDRFAQEEWHPLDSLAQSPSGWRSSVGSKAISMNSPPPTPPDSSQRVRSSHSAVRTPSLYRSSVGAATRPLFLENPSPPLHSTYDPHRYETSPKRVLSSHSSSVASSIENDHLWKQSPQSDDQESVSSSINDKISLTGDIPSSPAQSFASSHDSDRLEDTNHDDDEDEPLPSQSLLADIFSPAHRVSSRSAIRPSTAESVSSSISEHSTRGQIQNATNLSSFLQHAAEGISRQLLHDSVYSSLSGRSPLQEDTDFQDDVINRFESFGTEKPDGLSSSTYSNDHWKSRNDNFSYRDTPLQPSTRLASPSSSISSRRNVQERESDQVRLPHIVRGRNYLDQDLDDSFDIQRPLTAPNVHLPAHHWKMERNEEVDDEGQSETIRMNNRRTPPVRSQLRQESSDGEESEENRVVLRTRFPRSRLSASPTRSIRTTSSSNSLQARGLDLSASQDADAEDNNMSSHLQLRPIRDPSHSDITLETSIFSSSSRTPPQDSASNESHIEQTILDVIREQERILGIGANSFSRSVESPIRASSSSRDGHTVFDEETFQSVLVPIPMSDRPGSSQSSSQLGERTRGLSALSVSAHQAHDFEVDPMNSSNNRTSERDFLDPLSSISTRQHQYLDSYEHKERLNPLSNVETGDDEHEYIYDPVLGLLYDPLTNSYYDVPVHESSNP